MGKMRIWVRQPEYYLLERSFRLSGLEFCLPFLDTSWEQWMENKKELLNENYSWRVIISWWPSTFSNTVLKSNQEEKESS